jgi:molybdopterin-guanine dinucleotide biosynthesis protein A
MYNITDFGVLSYMILKWLLASPADTSLIMKRDFYQLIKNKQPIISIDCFFYQLYSHFLFIIYLKHVLNAFYHYILDKCHGLILLPNDSSNTSLMPSTHQTHY